MRVIIAGGTGMIGKPLAADLVKQGYEVVVLSRSPGVVEGLPKEVKVEGWDARTANGWGHLADGAGAIINLAGENLAGESFFPARWTGERKKRIIESRTNAGKAVVEAVEQASQKPALVVQASAVGCYGPHTDEIVTEDAPLGDDFQGQVCKAWEGSTAAVEAMGVRRVIIRTGVPLSFTQGALARIALPFKLFVGGPFGSGKQYLPWIHLDDEIGAIRFLIENANARGAFNLCSPNPVTNAEFSRILGKVMGRPSLVPAPAFAFEIAFGEVATIVLNGWRAIPKRLLELGYKFKFTDLEVALRDIYR